MPVSFPTSKRYFVSFRNGDVGLTPSYPVFSYYKNSTTLANIVPQPTFTELSNGTYYFTVPFTAASDPDIIFQIDGGPSIPTEEIRYQTSMASPKDLFLDEPISVVKDDVWNDTTDRGVGTKGDFVEHIGVNGDAVDDPTVFGKLYKARDIILGGTGYGGTGVDVKTTYDRIGTPLGGFSTIADQLGDPSGANSIAQDIAAVKGVVDTINIETDAASIADAVWDASTAGNTVPGTMGGLVDATKTAVDTINLETDPSAIADAVWDATTVGNIGVGTMGGLLNDASSGTSSAAAIADAVWDEALSGHTTAGSFGQTLQLEDSGLAQGGALSTVTLKAGASAITDFYKNGLIAITSGTGVGQSRSITAYDGGTKIATVDRDWGTTPVLGDGYIILPAAPSSSLTNAGIASAVWDKAISSHTLPGSFGQTLQLLNNDTAAAGTVSSITLGASAVGTLDFYKNALLVITGGTGAGQARAITAYTALKVATVDRNWGVTPDNTSEYIIIPAANVPVDNASIADAVWDEALAGHLTAGSTGEKLNAPSVDNAAIADAVWDEATAGHATAGTYGLQATDTKTAVDAINIETDAASIAGAVWDVAIAGHVGAGSTGEKLNSGGVPYARFYANGDTVAPFIIQVTSPKHTQVRVTYSEAVVMDTSPIGALNTANYTIPGLTVTGAQSLTAQQVMLTTSAQTPNFLYTLTVTNVEDLQGNPIA